MRKHLTADEINAIQAQIPVKVTKYIQILCPIQHHISIIPSVKILKHDNTGNITWENAKFCDIKILQQYLINNGFFPIPIHNSSVIHALVSQTYYQQDNTDNIEQLIIDIFKNDFWQSNLKTWKNIKFFTNINGAIENIEMAITSYNNGKFYASNNLSTLLWEPIFRAILSKNNIPIPYKQGIIKTKVFDLLKEDNNSEIIIDYLDKFAWATTDNEPSDMSHPVRHDVAHKSERIVTQKTALNSLFVVFYLLEKLRLS